MSPRKHALLARALIDACDGVEDAERACRVGQSQLYNYCSPNHPATMPVDVIAELEDYCGQAIYSRALANRNGGATPSQDIVIDALEINERAAHLSTEAHAAMRDGRIDEGERRRLNTILRNIRERMEAVDATVNGDPLIQSQDRRAG
jgi:hypothetical protein